MATTVTGKKAQSFRVSDVREAYIFSCIKVAVWTDVLKNHTAERAADLEAMFRRGALDHHLKQIASRMDENFEPDRISWVRSAELQETPSTTEMFDHTKLDQECICMGAVWHDSDTQA